MRHDRVDRAEADGNLRSVGILREFAELAYFLLEEAAAATRALPR